MRHRIRLASTLEVLSSTSRMPDIPSAVLSRDLRSCVLLRVSMLHWPLQRLWRIRRKIIIPRGLLTRAIFNRLLFWTLTAPLAGGTGIPRASH